MHLPHQCPYSRRRIWGFWYDHRAYALCDWANIQSWASRASKPLLLLLLPSIPPSIRFLSKLLPSATRLPAFPMPVPFAIEYITKVPGQPQTILVTRDTSDGLKLRSVSGQWFWDSAQEDLHGFPALRGTKSRLHLRLDTLTRDHRRTYCTVRAPGVTFKYAFKFFCGVGEWVAFEIPGYDLCKRERQVLPRDFYWRKTIPVDLNIFWGLNGLLRHSWYPSHFTTCKAKHYDVFINMLPANTSTLDRASVLALCNSKNLTHLQVCADAKVATLFQVLIGLERATNLSSLAHCLTKVYKSQNTCGVELGFEFLFEDTVRGGILMHETGWFDEDFSCLLVSTKRSVLNSKYKHTFMFQEVIKTENFEEE